MIWHMNAGSFPEMKFLIIKLISYKFQNISEEYFIDLMDSAGISEFLENQELTLMLKKYIDELRSMVDSNYSGIHNMQYD